MPINESTRRQPLLSPRRRSKVGETAGDCAAVWCCCPCAALHLVILAVYRLPVGLWRKKKRNMLLKKKRKHGLKKNQSVGDENGDGKVVTDGNEEFVGSEFVEWEKEMMGRFYGGGFWRSDSQRTEEDEDEEDEDEEEV